jgi:hypothetical protein
VNVTWKPSTGNAISGIAAAKVSAMQRSTSPPKRFQVITIRKTYLGTLAGAGLLVALAASAFGDSVTIDRVFGYYGGAGGETHIIPSDTSLLNNYASVAKVTTAAGTGFESFCLEYDAHLLTGAQNASISGGAIPGGPGAVGGSDPISKGTAWLYSQFAAGTLPGYNYTGIVAPWERVQSARYLQNAIWWLEGESAFAFDASNPFMALVVSPGGFGSAGEAMTDSNGAYGVAVLNLGEAPDFSAQDQLVAVPDAGATLTLFGLAFGGVSLLRRKLA